MTVPYSSESSFSSIGKLFPRKAHTCEMCSVYYGCILAIYHKYTENPGISIQNQLAGEDEILHTSWYAINVAFCQISAQ